MRLVQRDSSSVPIPESFGQQTDNAAKYEGAGGLERLLVSRFRDRLLAEIGPLGPRTVLDAGCGEGHVTEWLSHALPGTAITGLDGRGPAMADFRARNPSAIAVEGDLTASPFGNGEFDLVVCTEVLEHLPDPRTAVHELARVCGGHLLLTVPHEPFFRAGNVVRGRYLTRLGSTPGHRWTWGRRGFLHTIEAAANPIRWFSAFPWQGALAAPRRTR